MAFSEVDLARIEKAVGGLCRRRNRPEFKAELSLEYRVKGHNRTLAAYLQGSADLREGRAVNRHSRLVPLREEGYVSHLQGSSLL